MSSNYTNEKIETLKHTMDRYDHYYDSINNKSNLYLTLNTFLLGGIITGYYSINEEVVCGLDLFIFVILSLLCSFLSIAYLLWATLPYLNKQSEIRNGSVLYFGSVANLSFQSFNQMYSEMTDENRYEDYLQQVHLLALGLQKKFRRLKIATYLLGGCFICIMIIGLIILK